MSISQRIIWSFSESYISREHSFLSKKPRFFAYGPAIFIIGCTRILRLYFLQKSMKMDIVDVPDHVVVKTAARINTPPATSAPAVLHPPPNP